MEQDSVPPSDAKPKPGSASGSRAEPRWRIALLLASSAALSGIAVVLWNRRSLQLLRQPTQPADPVQPLKPVGVEPDEVIDEFI